MPCLHSCKHAFKIIHAHASVGMAPLFEKPVFGLRINVFLRSVARQSVTLLGPFGACWFQLDRQPGFHAKLFYRHFCLFGNHGCYLFAGVTVSNAQGYRVTTRTFPRIQMALKHSIEPVRITGVKGGDYSFLGVGMTTSCDDLPANDLQCE